MDDKEHVLLSPSTSHRWLECTPSVYLEAIEFPESETSIYAEEGTEAHLLAQIKLSYMLGQISASVYSTKFEVFINTSKYYTAEFNEFVNDYCQEVMDIIKKDYEGIKTEVYLETRVNYDDVVPEGSGTSDVIILGPDFIHIVDLKYGKGVPVSAIGNPQPRLYALGALKTFRLKGLFKIARMTIIQPRLYDKSTDEMSVADLNDWAINYVKPRAELAFAGKGSLVPGEHCRFCKRKGKCDALAQAQFEAAKAQFEVATVETPSGVAILEPHQMTPEMLGQILTIAPSFIAWFSDVEKYAKAAMIREDLKIPGFKVVKGRSDRIITDKAAVAEILKTSGFSEDDYLSPRKLLGITALEKNVGKKVFDHIAGDYVIKPEGALTVVPESDKREAVDASKYRLSGQEFDIEIKSEED